jgi:hypothetical protein
VCAPVVRDFVELDFLSRAFNSLLASSVLKSTVPFFTVARPVSVQFDFLSPGAEFASRPRVAHTGLLFSCVESTADLRFSLLLMCLFSRFGASPSSARVAAGSHRPFCFGAASQAQALSPGDSSIAAMVPLSE